MKLNKRLTLFFVTVGLLFATFFSAAAQSSNHTPYSRFGIGEVLPQQNLRSASMGGIGQGVNTAGVINPVNPASYAAFDSMAFLFDIAVSASFDRHNSEKGGTAKSVSGTVNYINVGFPITKWWRTSLGITPVSSVGYDILQKDQELDMNVNRSFWADGGTNRAYWGNSFKITKNLAIGLNINYLFGNIATYRMLYFPDSAYMRNLKVINNTNIQSFTFRPGIQYMTNIHSKYRLTIGATYGIAKQMRVSLDQTILTMLQGYETTATETDTISHQLSKDKLYYPMDLSVGFVFEKPGHFLMGADFSWANWEKYTLSGVHQGMKNSWTLNIGGEYLPKHLSPAKYGSRIAYRFGFYTRQDLYHVENRKNGVLTGTFTDINEYAFTAGIGLPIARSKSRINIHFESGWMGTTENELIRETFFKIGLGVSLSEMWFMKRRYL